MTSIKVPGSEVRLDPDKITRIEISAKNSPNAFLKISLRGRAGSTVVMFASRKEAIEFYEAIWKQRHSSAEQIVKVGEFG